MFGCFTLKCASENSESCLFCRRFLDKTKNEWEHRASFEKVAGKYDMVFMDYSTNEKAKHQQPIYLLSVFVIKI